jgi:hypothetical protein
MTMEAPPAHRADEEADQPFPPRFRQLKRWTIIGLVVVIGLVGLRIWWGHEAQRRLDALVAESQAQGRKILLSDYVPPNVPDEANAAVMIRAAAKAIVKTKEQDEWIFDSDLPLTRVDVRVIDDLRSRNREALRLAREARKLTQVDWGVRPRTPMMMVMMPPFNEVRRLAAMIQAIALYEHTRGNDAAALEHARDILFQSRALEGDPVCAIISHLVAAGIRTLATQLLVQIAPDLKVGPQHATPQQLRLVIDELLDEDSARRGIAKAWDMEQMGKLDNIPFYARQQLSNPVATVFKPMFILDSARGAREIQLIAKTYDEPDFTRASAKFRLRRAQSYPVMYRTTRVMSDVMAPPNITLLRRYYANMAERRAAAILLAMRLYAVDHEGKLPAALDELVPRYLKAMPLDPFTADAPFKYRPHGPSPMLYSVGVNGVDDRGAVGTAKGLPLDIIFPLSPRPHVTTAPATAPDASQ